MIKKYAYCPIHNLYYLKSEACIYCKQKQVKFKIEDEEIF